MRLISHIVIARHIAEEFSFSWLARKAFIAGSAEPDCIPVTYFRGFRQGRGVNGHSWDNISSFISELSSKALSSDLPILMYFHLGRLCHYLVDSFTYPHNSCFSGTLAEHMEYEHELHRHLERRLGLSQLPYVTGKEFSMSWLMRLHEEYLGGTHGIRHDISYSLYALCAAVSAALSTPLATDSLVLSSDPAI